MPSASTFHACGRARPTPSNSRCRADRAPGPASTPTGIVTECYPRLEGGRGGARSATTSSTTNASVTNYKTIRKRCLGGFPAWEGRRLGPRGAGGSGRAPSPKVSRRRQAHAEEVFVYVCVCVRVERCARRNGNYRQPLLMGANSRAFTTGFVHNKNETSPLSLSIAHSLTHKYTHTPAGKHAEASIT